MPEFFNAIYSTPDVFNREFDAINTLSHQDRSLVAAALAEAWNSFEVEFGDEAGFKQSTVKSRTGFRLDLLQKVEFCIACDQKLEARGIRLLVLYLRGFSHTGGKRKRHMYACLRELIRFDLRHQNLNASVGNAMLSASVPIAIHH